MQEGEQKNNGPWKSHWKKVGAKAGMECDVTGHAVSPQGDTRASRLAHFARFISPTNPLSPRNEVKSADVRSR
jgi:hypothetical protein